jgi:hypothetical protein
VIEPDDAEFLAHGTHIEVRQRFDGRWTRGFVVETANKDGYMVRREHDGMLLPEPFAPDEVRSEKRRLFHWPHFPHFRH